MTVALLALGTVACGVAPVGVTATKSAQDSGDTGGAGLFPTDSSAPPDTTSSDHPAATDPSSTDSSPPDTSPDTSAPTDQVVDGVVDFGEAGPTHPAYDGFLTAALGDIQQYWAETFPATYGSAWKPLSGGIFAAYPSRTSPIPGCGGSATSTYEDVQRGTAFYCADGDFMAYDDAEGGLPALVDLLGKEAVAIVLAHEFGHAIQQRAGEWDQPGVLKEQQADCFAGAWAAHVAAGDGKGIRFDDAAVRAGLIAMIYVRDPLESDGLADPNAHGTGFDRVGAFKDGFEGGAARCKTFFTEDRLSQLIDVQWDPTDTSGGNLPIIDPNPDPKLGPNDIITAIPASLKFFWTHLAAADKIPFTPPTLAPFSTAGPYPSCDGIDPASWPKSVQYCAADNVIHWDKDYATSLSTQPLTGDMSVGYLLSNAYSDAFQHALHRTATGEQRALFSDCLTGAWVASIVPPIPDDREDQLRLSAGDLDEAIVTAIARADEHADTNVNGSAFEKIGAFRTGVLGGRDACRDTTG